MLLAEKNNRGYPNQAKWEDHEPGRWPTAAHSMEPGPEATLTNPWIVQNVF